MTNPNSEEHKKPQKRIEYRGENVRVSRTGGIAVTKTCKKDGVGATLNKSTVSVCRYDYFRMLEWGFKTEIFNVLEDTIVVLLNLIFPKVVLVRLFKIKEGLTTF
jgi:hypothetical protein